MTWKPSNGVPTWAIFIVALIVMMYMRKKPDNKEDNPNISRFGQG
jgi:hypothetical protein